MGYEKVLGERKFPTYEQLKSGLLRLIDEGKIAKEDAVRLLPELAESEDERIRKEMIEFFQCSMYCDDLDTEKIKRWVTYLEKQKEQKQAEGSGTDGDIMQYIEEGEKRGIKEVISFPEKYGLQKEQKPVEWSEEDEKMVKFYEDDCNNRIGNMSMKDVVEMRLKFKGWVTNRIKFLRPQPKQKWSKEDNKRYISIGTTLETSAVLSKEDYDANMVWLRDLVNSQKYSSPQPHWKPSKEQMWVMKLFVEKHRDTANQLIGGWSLFDTFESLYNDLLKLM